jgi:hypothetical protein
LLTTTVHGTSLKHSLVCRVSVKKNQRKKMVRKQEMEVNSKKL